MDHLRLRPTPGHGASRPCYPARNSVITATAAAVAAQTSGSSAGNEEITVAGHSSGDVGSDGRFLAAADGPDRPLAPDAAAGVN